MVIEASSRLQPTSARTRVTAATIPGRSRPNTETANRGTVAAYPARRLPSDDGAAVDDLALDDAAPAVGRIVTPEQHGEDDADGPDGHADHAHDADVDAAHFRVDGEGEDRAQGDQEQSGADTHFGLLLVGRLRCGR